MNVFNKSMFVLYRERNFQIYVDVFSIEFDCKDLFWLAIEKKSENHSAETILKKWLIVSVSSFSYKIKSTVYII